MTMTRCRPLALAFAAIGFCSPLSAQTSHYHVVKHIRIGGSGGWDYLTVDPAAHRLYLSHGTQVEVVDLTNDSVIGRIPNTPGVHGIAFVPDAGKGYTSNGRDTSVTVFDLKTLAVLGRIHVTGANPDAILYDPLSRRVFTFNGTGKSATVIDVATGTVVGTVELGGKPEAAVSDGKGRIYVNIEDTAELAVFDARTLAVLARWSLKPCEEPTGLAFDQAHHRLFAACHNKLLTIIDEQSGKVIATPPIGEGTDGAAFDPALQLAFTTNGTAPGTLTVVHEDSPDRFTVADNVTTQRGARTIALDPVSHRVYTSTAQYGPPPAPTAERPNPRPPVIDGPFEVLVLEP